MARYTVDNRTTPIDFECNNDALRRTMQNCKNLIMCRMGEVPYDRMRGVNPALFDMGIDQINEQLMPEIDRVLGWEPNATAVSGFAALDENGETIITVVVEINKEEQIWTQAKYIT